MIRLLLAFGPARPTARADQLARELGVPLSSVYRYLAVLREAGLVAESGRGSYQLTPLVFGLAQAARLSNPIDAVVRPVLDRLRDETGEAALFIQRVGDYAVCAALAEASHRVRLSFEPGHPMPLYGGAGAKLLLASMAEPERTRYFAAALPGSLASRRRALVEELPIIAGRGWATSEGEVDEGVWAAAAIVRSGDEVLGSLSVAGPSFRIPSAERTAIVTRVREAAKQLATLI